MLSAEYRNLTVSVKFEEEHYPGFDFWRRVIPALLIFEGQLTIARTLAQHSQKEVRRHICCFSKASNNSPL